MADSESPAHSNLFPEALGHVRDWRAGRLEARSRAIYSSQALCISAFGAIALSPHGGDIIKAMLDSAGVELGAAGEPEVVCELRGRRDVLNEHGGGNPTCPDVLVSWPDVVLTVESKFTEHLGPCSQVKEIKTRRGVVTRPAACSGDHAVGSDLRTKTDAPCRLTIREGDRTPRLYWEVGEQLFLPDVLAIPRRPCPFRDGHYQLMRNVCFAARLAELERRPRFGFLLAYAKAARVAGETEQTFAEFRDMLLPHVRPLVGTVTYEEIARIARRSGERELAAWLDDRLPAGVAAKARRSTSARIR